MHAIIARTRSLWRGLRRRADVEAEMTEEFQHHLALLTEDFVRRGFSPEEAARLARVEFGHIPSHKEDARAARGIDAFDRLRFSWLDVKLGLRLLRKHRGLSLVSVIGMSVAIAVAAGYFGAIRAFMDPTLPLHDGARIVAIQNAVVANAGEDRQTLQDFVAWRDELKTVRELAAFMPARRNLVVQGRSAELVELARMTASGFRLARVSPLLGRPLLDEDEREGAPPVVVIAHDEWQRVFGGDPAILGRPVRLGSEVHTVVGVMPAGFHFPINHRYWAPLPVRLRDAQRGDGPSLFIFGRLADGATRDAAQAELAVVGARMAVAHPETHGQLRPRVVPYTHPIIGITSPTMAMAIRGLQIAVGLLLVLVSANVAVLVYARTATRAGEIAMRTALGASRKRVITQLFAEAFVLSVVAAVIGLTIAGTALEWMQAHLARDPDAQLPFWVDLGLSPGLIAYVAALAVLGGVIVGVLPALKATGRHVQAGLQQLGTRGSQRQLGRTWTSLIVVQVAIAVAVLPFAVDNTGKAIRRGTAEPGYPAHQLLRTWLSLEPEAAPVAVDTAVAARALQARFVDRAGELLRRLEAEPSVAGVTFASNFPGDDRRARVEVEGTAPRTNQDGGWVGTSRIDPGLLAVFDVPIVAGRAFVDADARDSTVVIVDQLFVERFLGGASALGRRVRFLRNGSGGEPGGIEPGPWMEVVGVVPAFMAASDLDESPARLYRPMALERASVVNLVVRSRGGAGSALSRRVRDVAAAVDPALQLDEMESAAEAEQQSREGALFVAIGVTVVTGSVLLLSATGIYAMMAFTVARRRREIGIRAALGADRRRILAGVFARASRQLGVGVLSGLILAFVVDRAVGGGPLVGNGVILLPLVAALMMGIGLLAALGPARRGLAVQPTEALREE
ncbi:MAG: ABC transporter permease [Gemmatirosa sp.]